MSPLLLLLFSIISINANADETTLPNIKLENKKYRQGGNKDVEFTDVNGLRDIIEFEVELIASGFTFLEGPRWIKSDTGNGYLLFTELTAHKIWKYDEHNQANPLEVVADFEELECGPCGIAWHKDFANELWIACFLSGHVLKLNTASYAIEAQYDYTNFARNNGIKFMVDDIIMDGRGNVYFTDMPVKPVRNITNPYHRGGTFMISRDNMDEIKLIELIDFGPNGIALRKDEQIFTVSNCIDKPLDSEFHKRDLSKAYIRGYNIGEDAVVPFMYFNPYKSEFENYFGYEGTLNYMLDSSGFDYDGNMWQAVYLHDAQTNELKGGQASIVWNNENGTDPRYIGTVRVRDTSLAFNNLLSYTVSVV